MRQFLRRRFEFKRTCNWVSRGWLFPEMTLNIHVYMMSHMLMLDFWPKIMSYFHLSTPSLLAYRHPLINWKPQESFAAIC